MRTMRERTRSVRLPCANRSSSPGGSRFPLAPACSRAGNTGEPVASWRFLASSPIELEQAGVSAGKIEVVYDGVDLVELRDEPRLERGLAVALASTDPQKGRDLAEKAALLAELQIVFSDDLARDFRRASQFVYLTRSEGLGSAALLAMSFGLPVIASRVGGLPEVVIDQETGLLVENEPADIARAMRRLADDPPYAARLGRNGRQRVEQFFSRRQMIEGTIRAYEKVLGLV